MIIGNRATCVILFSIAFLIATVAARAQGPGDSCATAIEVTGDGLYPFDSTTAGTSEGCDFTFWPGTRVAWFTYTAPGFGEVTIDTCTGTSFDTVIAAYAGDECDTSCFAEIDYNDDWCEFQSRLTFPVFPGQTYKIAVGGYDEFEYGPGQLNVAFATTGPRPCEEATLITEPGTYPFDTTSAGEDNPCRPERRTRWFRYVAPASGSVIADTCGSSFNTHLTAFAGEECPSDCTTRIAENDSYCGTQAGLAIDVVAGQTYYFAVSGSTVSQYGTGALNLYFFQSGLVPGDTCSDALPITTNGVYPFDTTGASPNEACRYLTPSPTLWFAFDVPTSGQIRATTCPGGVSQFNSTLFAFVTIGDACPVDCSTVVDDALSCGVIAGEHRVDFYAPGGSTVYLQVSGRNTDDFGEGTLSFEFTPIEGGNTCAEAGAIEGSGVHTFDTTSATANDPCRPGARNLWYSFTAPATGRVVADTCGSSFDSHLAVHSGPGCPTGCSSLIVQDGSACGGTNGRVEFNATLGETYYFSVSGETAGDFGTGSLNILFESIDAGESCAEAPSIAGNGVYQVDLVGKSMDDPCQAGNRTVWYSFTAPGNGDLLVTMCGQPLNGSWDPMLNIYEGSCDPGCGDRIASNDESCGLLPRIETPVQAGRTYKIAIIAKYPSVGGGSVEIQFTPDGTGTGSLGDINGDGTVNVADVTLLGNLVAANAPPSNEVGDINGDNVVNEADVQLLAELIVD